MNKDVVILIDTIHRSIDNGDTYSEHYEESGIYKELPDKIYISYVSINEDSDVRTRNTLKFESDTLTRQSRGQTNSDIVFRTGHNYTTIYTTPYGRLNMGFLTKCLRFIEDKNCVNIQLEYIMSIENTPHEEIEMKIVVKNK